MLGGSNMFWNKPRSKYDAVAVELVKYSNINAFITAQTESCFTLLVNIVSKSSFGITNLYSSTQLAPLPPTTTAPSPISNIECCL